MNIGMKAMHDFGVLNKYEQMYENMIICALNMSIIKNDAPPAFE
jgi:hypothetical protein